MQNTDWLPAPHHGMRLLRKEKPLSKTKVDGGVGENLHHQNRLHAFPSAPTITLVTCVLRLRFYPPKALDNSKFSAPQGEMSPTCCQFPVNPVTDLGKRHKPKTLVGR
jgi:hypothetical protein